MTARTGAMQRDNAHRPVDGESVPGIPVSEAAALPAAQVLDQLDSTPAGLDADEAGRRRALVGPNAVRTHHAQPLRILGRQLRSPVFLVEGRVNKLAAHRWCDHHPRPAPAVAAWRS